jgi:hypothetical protein
MLVSAGYDGQLLCWAIDHIVAAGVELYHQQQQRQRRQPLAAAAKNSSTANSAAQPASFAPLTAPLATSTSLSLTGELRGGPTPTNAATTTTTAAAAAAAAVATKSTKLATATKAAKSANIPKPTTTFGHVWPIYSFKIGATPICAMVVAEDVRRDRPPEQGHVCLVSTGGVGHPSLAHLG